MSPLRALLLLATAAAVCARRIPAGARLSTEVNANEHLLASVQAAATALEKQIARIETQSNASDIIDDAIRKLKEIISKIKDGIKEAEENLLDSLKDTTENLASELNDILKKVTKHDFHLLDNWKNFEAHTAKCSKATTNAVEDILKEIRADAQSCSAKQVAEAKEIGTQILEVIHLVETVPPQTIKNIRSCVSGSGSSDATQPADDPADQPGDDPSDQPADGPADQPGDDPSDQPADGPADQPGDDPSDQPADGPADQPGDGPSDQPADVPADQPGDDPVQRNRRDFPGSNIFKKAKCVAGALFEGAKQIKPLARLVYELNKEIDDLTSKKTRKELKKCVKSAVSGKGKELQETAAKLAYCVISPGSQ